jgi:hypothetical protein
MDTDAGRFGNSFLQWKVAFRKKGTRKTFLNFKPSEKQLTWTSPAFTGAPVNRNETVRVSILHHPRFRLKLLEKKKTELALKSRKEIADYISAGKVERAKIRVEHIIREDYLVEAMEILEMYCDLLLARSLEESIFV